MANLDDLHAVDETNKEAAGCGGTGYETEQRKQREAVCYSGYRASNDLKYKSLYAIP